MSVHPLAVILGNGSPKDHGRSHADGYERLVLLAIANLANERGFAWAKTKTLAKSAHVHRGTVNRRCDDLINLGELRMFTRGHYQSPAFVITIVDYPLTNDEIRQRLLELDPTAEWEERLPGQASLPLERLSQTATISENHTAVSPNHEPHGSDQDLHPDRGRENRQNGDRREIVAERDDLSQAATGGPGEIVAQRDDMVADSDEIVAVARRSSDPGRNRKGTARGKSTLSRTATISEHELRELARERAAAKGAHNLEGLTSKILREDRDDLVAELRERHHAQLMLEARGQCARCDDRGFHWPDEDTAVPCAHPEILEEATH